uniref:Polydeoxyribonucleotide synthase [ATP] n=2 Tax=Mucochytrium quahogii TaxID=96639 RepID=A0A7S2RMT0_9STRA|mmetsp:Transcript_6168/g.10561  ORF Transcript_6168/g.10561 Transcript_6168/m.10561 type:complete len:469 (+) Transcript_6168:668-2074(+)
MVGKTVVELVRKGGQKGSRERIWRIALGIDGNRHAARLTREWGAASGKMRESVSDSMNINKARLELSKLVQDKLSLGYEGDIPDWIKDVEKQVNVNLNDVMENDDDIPFHAYLRKNDRYWSVQVDGVRTYRKWGKVDMKEQTSTRLYTEGKGGKSANQQARLEAMRDVEKKIANGYKPLDETEGCSETVPVPMLATSCDLDKLVKNNPDKLVMVQPKLDGLRCIADLKTGRLYSRTRKEIFTMQHIVDIIKGSVTEHVRWVDGELYHHGMSIQQLNSIIRGAGSSETDRHLVEYHAFDHIHDSGFDKRFQHLTEWHETIKCGEGPSVKLTETCLSSVSDLRSAHERMTSLGFEGLMVRLLEDSYARGTRSRCLQKIKTFQSEEFVCLDIVPQQNQEIPIAGSFLMKLNNTTTFYATPKSSIEEKKEMWENRDKYKSGEFLGIVQFFDLSDDGVPRFPILVGFRHKDDL